MGKRKKRSSSDKVNEQTKSSKVRGPSEDISVSDVLQSSFSVLYPETDNSVFENCDEANMTDQEPTTSDIMTYLKKMDGRITEINVRLKQLDKLEEKANMLEVEMKSMHVKMSDLFKNADARINKLCDRIDLVEFTNDAERAKLDSLISENDKLKDKHFLLTITVNEKQFNFYQHSRN